MAAAKNEVSWPMSDTPDIIAETPNPALMLGGRFAQMLHDRLHRPVIDLRDNSIFPALGQICLELSEPLAVPADAPQPTDEPA
jgi:hypothetical protein